MIRLDVGTFDLERHRRAQWELPRARSVLGGTIMRRVNCVLWACCLMANIVFAGDAAPGGDAQEPATEPYPLDYFARRPVLGNARLSPDGERLALMKIPSKAGDPIIEVYDASDLAKVPFRMNADPMEITGFSWISDTDIVFTARQQIRKRIEGFNRGTYGYKLGTRQCGVCGNSRHSSELGISIEHVTSPKARTTIIVSMVEGGHRRPCRSHL